MKPVTGIAVVAAVLFGSMLPARSDLFYSTAEYNKVYNRKVAAELEIEWLKKLHSNEKGNFESKIRDLQGIIENLEEQLGIFKTRAKEQEDSANRRIEDLEKRTDILKQKGSDREKELIQENRDLQSRFEKERDELRKKLDDERDAHIQSAKKQRDECQSRIDDMQRTIGNLTNDLAGLKDLTKRQKEELARMESQADELATQLKEEIDKGDIRLRKFHNKLIINLDDKICFDSGSSELKKEILPALNKIVQILNKYSENRIVIEGNTDNVPIISKRFRDNWELSTERALSVLGYILKNKQLDSRRFSAAGYGEFNPIVQNDTSENRSLNRRVDIVVLPRVKDQ